MCVCVLQGKKIKCRNKQTIARQQHRTFEVVGRPFDRDVVYHNDAHDDGEKTGESVSMATERRAWLVFLGGGGGAKRIPEGGENQCQGIGGHPMIHLVMGSDMIEYPP